MRADETLTLNSSGQLDNSGGLVSSSKNLNILDGAASKSLAILNHNGKLIAGQKLSIDSRSLGGDGQTLSLGDISLKLSEGYVHSGQLQANGSIDLQTAGNLDNQARLVAGQALKVTAGNLNNTATGELSATNLTLDTGGTLTNRGLLDGQTTRVNAGTLNNLGSGRIYGDQLSVSAGALHNDVEDGKAAVIAARNRLDIGVGSLLNREHALLFSAGDLYIGGALDANGHATGSAGEIRNASATIEALGDMGLASAVLRNTNEHFSTQEVEVSRESVLEYQLTGSTNRYRPEQISIYNSEVDYLVTPEGEREDWNLYNYTRVTRETQILSSDPAQILAGGNLRLDVADALNDKSRIIAGGTIGGNLGRLENTEAPGERVTTESGIVTHFYRIQKKGRDKQGADNAAYNPAASIVDIFLKPGAYLQNTAHVGSGTQVGDLNLGRVDQPASGAGAAQVNVGNGRVISPVLEVTAVQTKNDAGVAESIRTGGIDTRVPDNSLFQVNPQATSGYLIESDPRFTNYRAWLSSDYMLDRLKLDPGLTLTRLGDGFYEQKLIREQIAQLTGRRFLDGYGNDETQYRALLDNGLTYAQAWNLVPGVALTPEQMAQLTSDIVWLVAKDVTLPDGSVTRALVPQVYVRVRQGDIDGSGALMAGQNLDLNIQNDLVNSGTLAGRDVLSITAQNIQNLGGRLTGTDVGVKAAGDLNNLGGLIDASHSLTAVAGRDINLTSSTQDSQSAQGSATRLSRVAGLFVSDPAGELIATAGRDLNLNAAQVVNSGAGGKTTLRRQRHQPRHRGRPGTAEHDLEQQQLAQGVQRRRSGQQRAGPGRRAPDRRPRPQLPRCQRDQRKGRGAGLRRPRRQPHRQPEQRHGRRGAQGQEQDRLVLLQDHRHPRHGRREPVPGLDLQRRDHLRQRWQRHQGGRQQRGVQRRHHPGGRPQRHHRLRHRPPERTAQPRREEERPVQRRRHRLHHRQPAAVGEEHRRWRQRRRQHRRLDQRQRQHQGRRGLPPGRQQGQRAQR